MPSFSAMAPAAKPCDPACTSRRNISSLASWAIDESSVTASLVSMILYFHKHRNIASGKTESRYLLRKEKIRRICLDGQIKPEGDAGFRFAFEFEDRKSVV